MRRIQQIKPERVVKYASLRLHYEFHQGYTTMKDLPSISGSEGALAYLQEHYRSLSNAQEFFTVLYLSRRNKVLNVTTIGQGNKYATIVDNGYLLTQALLIGSESIILCHNHPGGNTEPSDQDRKLTQKLKSALQLLDIALLDHIILTADENIWYSMAESGEL